MTSAEKCCLDSSNKASNVMVSRKFVFQFEIRSPLKKSLLRLPTQRYKWWVGRVFFFFCMWNVTKKCIILESFWTNLPAYWNVFGLNINLKSERLFSNYMQFKCCFLIYWLYYESCKEELNWQKWKLKKCSNSEAIHFLSGPGIYRGGSEVASEQFFILGLNLGNNDYEDATVNNIILIK